MRSHAKASSGGSLTMGGRADLGSLRRGALAGRGSSRDAGGSGAASRRSTHLARGLIVAAFVLLAVAPSAMASVFTRASTTAFGPDGTALSTFDFPRRLTFNRVEDKLFVDDKGAGKLHVFDAPALTPSGGAFPLTGIDDPSLLTVAVDNTAAPSLSAGNIYAVAGSTRTLYGFKADGTPLGGNFPLSLPPAPFPAGVAVDSSGTVYVSQANGGPVQTISKYDAAGNFLGTIDTTAQGGPASLAFDSNDDLFFTVIPLGGGQVGVYKYTAASGYSSASATQIPWSPEFAGQSPQAITVDTNSHTLYVTDINKVSAFDASTGAFFYDFATGLHFEPNRGGAGFEGLAVDQSTDTVYVSDATSGQKKVYAFGPAQSYTDATTILTGAKNITETSAEIGATITDNNTLTTRWRLQLSADGGATWFTPRMSSGTASGVTAGGQSNFAVGGTVIGYVDDSEKDEEGHTIFKNIDLFPNSDYKFRIVTNKGSAAASEVTSPAFNFKTVAGPPQITDIGAVQITDTSMRLAGTIDTRRLATGYVFEYGTTPALGSSTAPADLGADTKPITVSQVISGLKPNTTYYFRLAATNLTGSTTSSSKTAHTPTDPLPPANPANCPNEAVRQEQNSIFLPDCRAYEMVTPPDKNQGSATGRAGFAGQELLASFSRDGTGVAFCSSSLFGEPAGQLTLLCSPYVSHRGPASWSTVDPMPHYCPYDAATGAVGGRSTYISPQSFDRLAFTIPEHVACPASPLAPGAPLASSNLYRSDLRTNPFGLDLLSPNQVPLIPEDLVAGIGAVTVGGSADFSHIVYATFINQTAGSPPQGHFNKLYDWEEEGNGGCVQPGGCLSLLAVEPGGDPFEAGNSYIPASQEERSAPIPSAVSDDGSRIYFYHYEPGLPNPGDWVVNDCWAAGNCHLYLRENGTSTVPIGASECTSACGVNSSVEEFRWATPSGEKAFFESCAKLTDASAEARSCEVSGFYPQPSENLKLYRWDENAPPGHHLVDLSIDNEPADGSQPRAVDIVGASRDENADPASNAAPGNTVYFIANGQLVSGAPAPTFGGNGNYEPIGLKLYRWRWNGGAPSVDYIGPYHSLQDNGKPSEIDAGDPNTDGQHVHVTADGRYVVIQTTLALDAAGDRDSDSDLYRWDEAEGWLCISCQRPGVPSAGSVSTYTPHFIVNSFATELAGQVPEHTISDDGKRIFFSTPDALVAEDVNGEQNGQPKCPSAPPSISSGQNDLVYACQDVYEWHDGTISLLSTGTGSEPFLLMGATALGKDVFISTHQRMVGWDLDNQGDIYDVRTDGGYPEPPPAPPSCEGGESCHGAGTTAPNSSGAGTAVFEGPGNPAPPKHPKAPKQHKKKRQHKHAAAHPHRAANHNRRTGR